MFLETLILYDTRLAAGGAPLSSLRLRGDTEREGAGSAAEHEGERERRSHAAKGGVVKVPTAGPRASATSFGGSPCSAARRRSAQRAPACGADESHRG